MTDYRTQQGDGAVTHNEEPVVVRIRRFAFARNAGGARARASANRRESQGQLIGQFSRVKIGSAGQKSGALAWDREPRKARSVAGVVFTPARGVIHPSFPLRGRWERSAKSDKQAPSPSLVALYISSCGTRPRTPYCTAYANVFPGLGAVKLLLISMLRWWLAREAAPNPSS